MPIYGVNRRYQHQCHLDCIENDYFFTLGRNLVRHLAMETAANRSQNQNVALLSQHCQVRFQTQRQLKIACNYNYIFRLFGSHIENQPFKWMFQAQTWMKTRDSNISHVLIVYCMFMMHYAVSRFYDVMQTTRTGHDEIINLSIFLVCRPAKKKLLEQLKLSACARGNLLSFSSTIPLTRNISTFLTPFLYEKD